jgi:ATP-dependent RNA helicase DeaD
MRFSELSFHPAVSEAIAARGFETATPVQAAVRDPALDGRDLLVSAPTGSGKTLAFGTLIADALLDAPKAEGPRALVVVPTRELAAQVGRELGWLLERSRLRIGTFTGGTPVGPDLRALRAGVDVVVGTPGRLVDHLERGALSLADVRSLVLDEADEMLDLGFREDLEKLLGAAPAERRTLMFSATVPPEIARLASQFQRDAARLDLRAAAGERGHADISFRVLLVRAEDRLAAVVNTLLTAGDAKCIAFCRTRDRVADLHRRLAELGLRVEAIAGDRAQTERDRALAALREGSARVLVATDVAARGIDLPDVELVLHADLPNTAETLTHRSGRTGRAGRKGTTILVADVRERRKAERLLREAGLAATWAGAPDADEVLRQSEERLFADLMEASRGARPDAAASENTAALGDRLRAALPERVLLSVLLARELGRMPRGLALVPLDPRGPVAGERPRRERPDFSSAAIFRVNVGRSTGADPSSLLPLICRRGGITRHDVGAIRVAGTSATFEISAAAAAGFERSMHQPDPRSEGVTFELVRPPGRAPAGEPAATPPARAPRAARPAHAPRAHQARPDAPERRPGPPRRPPNRAGAPRPGDRPFRPQRPQRPRR